MAIEVEAHCQCGFDVSIISAPLFRCFPQSTNAVTLRATLIDSTLLTAVQEWIQESGLLPIQGILIEVDRTCQVAISSLADTECISEPVVPTTSPPTSVPMATDAMVTSPKLSSNESVVVIGGLTAGIAIALIFAVAIIVIVVAVLVSKARKGKLMLTVDKTSK